MDMRHICDNYNFILRCEDTGVTAVVDPSEAEGIIEFLEERRWQLDLILNTHHHWDHTDGNLALQQRYGCDIVGHTEDAHRIRGITREIAVDDTLSVGQAQANILNLEYHTLGHIGYYFPDSSALFCGDALFAMGCGRMFEGTPEQMLSAMQTLRALPDETRLYCAHEYTLANARFARYLEPENAAIAEHTARAKALRKVDMPTIPTTVAQEKASNPFLRWDVQSLLTSLGLQDAPAAIILAEIRRLKDAF